MDCRDQDGRVLSFELEWTDAAPRDPFVAVAAGRAHFRVADLVHLVQVIERLSS